MHTQQRGPVKPPHQYVGGMLPPKPRRVFPWIFAGLQMVLAAVLVVSVAVAAGDRLDDLYGSFLLWGAVDAGVFTTWAAFRFGRK
jgi:hypothetical protein